MRLDYSTGFNLLVHKWKYRYFVSRSYENSLTTAGDVYWTKIPMYIEDSFNANCMKIDV